MLLGNNFTPRKNPERPWNESPNDPRTILEKAAKTKCPRANLSASYLLGTCTAQWWGGYVVPNSELETKRNFPWNVGAAKYANRSGPACIPYDGVGKFITLLCGPHAIVSTAAFNEPIPEGVVLSTLFESEQMCPKDSFKWQELQLGCILWVPYGSPVFLTTISEQSVCNILPIFSKALVQTCRNPEVWVACRRAIQAHIEVNIGVKPWSLCGPAFNNWADTLD